MNPEQHIQPGLPREDALRRYAALVNGPDTVFSCDPVLPGRLDRLSELMHDPITEDEANALDDVLYRRRQWVDMVAWLTDDEPVSWNAHFARELARAEETNRRLREEWRKEDEERAKAPAEPVDVKWREAAKAAFLPIAKPCPECSTPAEHLDWSRYSFVSPFGTLFGGWKTRCHFCQQDVDDFVTLIGRSRRQLVRPAAPRHTDESVAIVDLP